MGARKERSMQILHQGRLQSRRSLHTQPRGKVCYCLQDAQELSPSRKEKRCSSTARTESIEKISFDTGAINYLILSHWLFRIKSSLQTNTRFLYIFTNSFSNSGI